jgi:hypothetical protein
MSWSDNVQNDNEFQAFFVRSSCRVKLTGWEQYSGSVYSTTIPEGSILASLKINGATYFLRDSAAGVVSDLEYYYDRDTGTIYIWVSGGGDPDDDAFHIIATIYLFHASQDTLWHQTPDDESTPVVLWKGLLSAAPEYRVTIPPLAMGYYPIEPTSLVLKNDQSLNHLLSHGSFHRTDCVVWQQAGPLDADNMEMIVNGLFGLTIFVDDSNITFQVVDRSIHFDGHVTLQYLGSENVDPKFAGTPLMKLWGVASVPSNADLDKPVFELMNIDYDSDAPTTSNNRKFALVHDPDSRFAETVADGQILKPGGGGFFRLNSSIYATKFRPGDKVWFDGLTDQYWEVDTVPGPGGTDIHLTVIPSGAGGQAGNLRTSFIKKVFLIKNGGETTYELTMGRDWTETLHTGDFRGITLTSTAEANVGASTYDPNVDSLWCNCIGKKTKPTFEFTPVDDDTNYDDAFHLGVNVLYDFLKEECGIDEENIDVDSFVSARGIVDWSVFLPVPFAQLTDAPTRRDVLEVLLKSMMLRAYFNSEGKFTLKPYGPAETSAGTVTKQDIISTSYQIDYSNLAKLIFVFVWDANSINRIAYSGTKADWLAGTAQIKFLTDLQVNQIASAFTSARGQYLHQVNRSQVVEFIVTSNSDDFQNRMRDLYGERHGMMKVATRRHFMQRSAGEDVTVQRPELIGETYDGSEKSNVFEVLEVLKSPTVVEFQLDDTKAAKDEQDESYW